MFKKLNIVLNVLLACVLVSAHSFSIASNDALDELVDETTKIKNYRANFKQKIKDQFDNLKDQSEGEFVIQKPYKFVWFTQSPFEQKIVSDGQYLWTFDMDLDQVNIQNLNKAMGNTPVFLLGADAQTLGKSFDVNKLETGESKSKTFELKPKEAGYPFERMMVLFKDGLLREILLMDTLGQKTIVDFSGVEVNQPIEPATFEFEIPDGVDVVDSRVIEDPNLP